MLDKMARNLRRNKYGEALCEEILGHHLVEILVHLNKSYFMIFSITIEVIKASMFWHNKNSQKKLMEFIIVLK